MKKRAPPLLLAAAAGLALSLTPVGARAQSFPLYVSNGSNNVLTFSSAGVESVFTNSGVSSPSGLAFDAAGNLYVANMSPPFANTIVKFTPGGASSAFADTGTTGSQGLAFDAAGNLYVANHFASTIERFTPAGVGSVFASAGVNVPQGLAFDTSGNLYASNAGSNSITKFTPGGVGTLFANTLAYPQGLAFDHAGNLFVADRNSDTIQKVTPGGAVSVFANTGVRNPNGLAFDAAGNLYATNAATNTIEKFTPAGVGTVFANTGLNLPTFIAFANAAGPKPLRVVSFSTPIPGGTGNFTGLPVAPGYSSSGQVAFYGTGAAGQQGIYRAFPSDPSIPPDPVKVADLNTAIPSGTGNFTGFTNPSDPSHPTLPTVSGTSFAFFGAGGGGQQGVYVSQNGPLSRVADAATLIPGGTGTFTAFTHPGIPPNPIVNGNNVGFFAAGAGGQQGVYARDYVAQTAPVKIADTATLIPGGTGNFATFPTDPSLSGTNLAFLATGAGGQQGVYRAAVGGAAAKVADLNTAIPSGAGNFTSFIPPNPVVPATDGTRVAFYGAGSGGQQGIYLSVPTDPLIPPDPIKVADTATAIPGGTGLFLSFADVSLSASDVAFLGFGANGQEGIYDLTGGSLLKVVDLNDILDGRSVTGLSLSATGLSGDPIAFGATFADGSRGIYATAVPEPGTVLLCAFAALPLAWAQKRRRALRS